MDLALTGKRALVTGATSGLGAAIAKLLAVEGVTVAIGGRDPARAEAVIAEIRAAGGSAHLALGDLATDDGAEACAASAGPVDILVNNAGRPPEVDGDAGWTQEYTALTLPAVRLIHRLSPAMREAGWGRIIQIASADALTPGAVPQPFASAKAALINMSLGLSKALGGTGVTVNTISPGMIATVSADTVERHGRQPIAGPGSLDGVASAVAWLASPLADYVTGANIRIDGGFSPAIN